MAKAELLQLTVQTKKLQVQPVEAALGKVNEIVHYAHDRASVKLIHLISMLNVRPMHDEPLAAAMPPDEGAGQ